MERGHTNKGLAAMGTGKGPGRSEYLQILFPGLQTTPFRVTSPADHKYTCISWATNYASDWWWPEVKSPNTVWPDSAAREVTLSAFTDAFLTIGYVVGGDESLEPGIETVAHFTDAAAISSHAARQQASGAWTSKLRNAEDIEHELHALEGDIYGKVALILKRPLAL
jgi:hypothetical protein